MKLSEEDARKQVEEERERTKPLLQELKHADCPKCAQFEAEVYSPELDEQGSPKSWKDMCSEESQAYGKVVRKNAGLRDALGAIANQPALDVRSPIHVVSDLITVAKQALQGSE